MMKLIAIPAAVLLIGALAACGDDSDMGMDHGGSATATTSAPTSASASTTHNDADVTFAQGMIPHHRQAVEMAALAATRASDAKVTELATEIEKAQQPEIDTMSGWLTAWGQKVPAADESTDHGGMDMGSDSSMPGMMTDAQMAAMENASGADFDRMFLEMMIEHHNGAISMAKTEQSAGENPDATALAAKIAKNQSAEITTMRTLLQNV